jgi:excisionase family DNA binding protein
LLTAEQVAAFWQVSTSLIYKLRREGKLPFVRIGTLYRFDPEVIRAWARGDVTPPRRVR